MTDDRAYLYRYSIALQGEWMMRLFSRTALAVFTVCAIGAGSARAATEPTTTIKGFYDTLTQTMQRGPQLGEKGRYDALAPTIRQSFDLTNMAQMAVGPSWAKLSPPERQQVTDAFARYTIATYADEFGRHKSEKLAVTGERKMPYGTIVETQVVQPDGDQTSVNYLMRQNGTEWQVADIYLQGTISQVANLRSQFGAVLLRGGAPALIDALNDKTARLVPNVAAS
jgi:phospholipid transport system substrate-binding protein